MACLPSNLQRPPALRPLALPLLAVSLLAPAAVTTPATPVVPVLAVSPEDGYHVAPDVAVVPGGAVIAWHAEVPGQAGPDLQIFARRYSPSGAPLGAPFPVNAAAAGQQRRPAVAAAPDGGFVVAWDAGPPRAILARRFAADGTPLSGDIAISESEAAHYDPDVAVAADGSFVVAWQLGDDVVLRRFDVDGAPLSGLLSPYERAGDTVIRMNPALVALPGGPLALAWEEVAAGATRVLLRRLDTSGAPLGQQQVVASSTAEELRDPALGASPEGALVVVWSTYTAVGGGIFARRYSPSGEPLGDAAPVAPREVAERFFPAVAVDPDGTAVVAWTDATQRDGAPAGIAARHLDAEGFPKGEPFYPRPPQLGPSQPSALAAAMGAGGGPLWVAWAQTPPQSADALSAVYARRVVEQLFEVRLPLVRR